jgi:hypothetical protein
MHRENVRKNTKQEETATSLGSRLLLLLLEEREERAARDLGDLEANTRDIADGATATTEPGDNDFVVLVNEVHATIHGHEGGNLLAVLDELDTHALTQRRVGLLGLHTEAVNNDTLGVRRALEGLDPGGAQVTFLVVLVGPLLLTTVSAELARSADTTGIT